MPARIGARIERSPLRDMMGIMMVGTIANIVATYGIYGGR